MWTYLYVPSNAFTFVFFLFQFKNKRVELLLQRFVRVVDTQLLKRIVLEALETEDVQHSNEIRVFFFSLPIAPSDMNAGINLFDQPVKNFPI